VKPKTQRLCLIGLGLCGLALATFLILMAFQESLIFYYLPSDLQQKTVSTHQRIRMGGLVEMNSVQQEGEKVTFKITDQKATLKVTYTGLLPDLFREGQGVVAEGFLKSPEEFQAESVLAKHDEKYMPKEVADQLKKEGLWKNAQ
jgi:cytochrome c-type biogenesis protein CcmE